MTETPAVRMSTACRPVRRDGKRSITVTWAPALASQYAVAGPAMDAPDTRTLRPDIAQSSLLTIDVLML